MLIVSLAGPAGVGKSTTAAAIILGLAQRHTTQPIIRKAAFCDPLRDAVQAIFGSDYRSQEAKAATDPYWADRLGSNWSTGRKILQSFGTDVCRVSISSEIWINALERRLLGQRYDVVILDDCRFSNEAAWTRRRHGLVVHIERQGIAWQGTHPSECGPVRDPADLVCQLDEPGNLGLVCDVITARLAADRQVAA